MEYGCIGEHLPHSFSKEIHEKIADYDYRLCELSKNELGPFLEKRDFKAINVTIPYKQAVIPYLFKTDDFARKIGAVNTIVNKNGQLFGYNTDFYGMCELIKRAGIDVKNKTVLILGTGGTSNTAFAVSEFLGAADIIKVSRKKSDNTVTYEQAVSEYSNTEIIINTTPVGMYPETQGCPIDISLFPKLEAVLDAVYNPLTTNIVAAAKQKGIKAANGLYMLVAQAVNAYEIFMDTKVQEGLSEKIYNDIFKNKQNIVLTGMPGSGKTTVGRLLAERMNRELFDTDDEIIKSSGMEISDIFKTKGEKYFRQLERETVEEISKHSGIIISTGGGAVLDIENIKHLKMNGKINFLNRSPELLIPTSDRPLASSAEAIFRRYSERINTYISAADEIIPGDDSPDAVAKEIERRHNR